MENAKELRSKKANVKSKLMGAVSMLVVSAIMLSSTTYAWFTLSTAPEVSGMSTTVGANGSLEVALLNDTTGADLGEITSTAGDSSMSANGSIVKSNVTWGNIVDLSDESYGLSGVTLYPSRLCWSDSTGTAGTLQSRANLLSYAAYGTDGRITELKPATAGTKGTSGFVGSPTSYGVRAIGESLQQAPESTALDSAKANFNNKVKAAKNNAVNALNASAEQLGQIAMKHARPQGNETYSKEQVEAINNAVSGLKEATAEIEKALKYAVMANAANGANGTILSFDDVQLSTSDAVVGTYYSKLVALNNKLNGISAIETSKDSYTWDDIETNFKALIDADTMTIGSGENAKTVQEVKDMSDEEQQTWGIRLARDGAPITVASGVFSETADFVDTLTSKTFVITEINCTVVANKTAAATTAYLTELGNTVSGYKYEGTGNAVASITNTYGYAIDLAFQTSKAGDLQLSTDAVSRVGESTEVTGSGSVYTAGTDADENALKALRIAFVDEENKLLAVGKLDIAAKSGTNYPVKLYSYTISEGVLTVSDTQVSNNKITTLKENTPTAITAIVFLDGDASAYAQGGATGTLDLQFKHSEPLVPMNYTGYVTK